MKRFALCFLALVMIFSLVPSLGCECGGPGPAPTLESSKNIDFIEGGEVALPNGASIFIPPAALDDDSAVMVRTVSDRPEPRDTNMLLGSQVYEFSVEGQYIFETPVIITIPYQESELPPGVSEEDIQVAYYDEMAEDWIPAGGEVVDTEQNLVLVATTHLSKQGLKEWWHSKWVTFVDNFRTQYYTTTNFKIEYVLKGDNAVPNEEYIKEIGKALERARDLLHVTGYKTRGKVMIEKQFPGKRPYSVEIREMEHLVRVVVTDVRDKKGKRQPGEEVPCWLGDLGSFIRLNNGVKLDTVKAAAAHEYFHLCQDLYFDLLQSKTYVWFCEATALWFEDVLYPAYNGYWTLLDANRNFISRALNTKSGEHGYGAGAFVKFLAWNYDGAPTKKNLNISGINLVKRVFEAIEEQSLGSGDVIEAIDSVLKTYGTTIEREFIKFADIHLTTRDFDEAKKWLESDQEKRYLSDSNRKIELKLDLPPLSAKKYLIGIGPTKVKGEVTLRVDKIAPDLQGVMVHAGLRASDIDYWPVFELLMKDTTVTISKFGLPLGDGADKDIMVLVAINGDREKSCAGSVTITITAEEEPVLGEVLVAQGQVDTSILRLSPEDKVTKNYVQLTINTGTGEVTGIVSFHGTAPLEEGGKISTKMDIALKGTYTKGEEGKPDTLQGTYESTIVAEAAGKRETRHASATWAAIMNSAGKIRGSTYFYDIPQPDSYLSQADDDVAFAFEATVQK